MKKLLIALLLAGQTSATVADDLAAKDEPVVDADTKGNLRIVRCGAGYILQPDAAIRLNNGRVQKGTCRLAGPADDISVITNCPQGYYLNRKAVTGSENGARPTRRCREELERALAEAEAKAEAAARASERRERKQRTVVALFEIRRKQDLSKCQVAAYDHQAPDFDAYVEACMAARPAASCPEECSKATSASRSPTARLRSSPCSADILFWTVTAGVMTSSCSARLSARRAKWMAND